jgi:hypothetical protein
LFFDAAIFSAGMADNNSGDIAVATDFPTAGSPPMDNDNSSNNNSSGNTGNHLIFSIQDGIEVTVLGTGKKPLCADEPATLLLYEYRLCVKRLQDDRLLFDMHIKQVDLILSAGAQNVRQYAPAK